MMTPHYERQSVLTDANGDVGWPLVVVLTGDCSLPDELKPELALEAQHVPIGESGPFPNPVEGSPRVAAALLVDFWGDKGEVNLLSICTRRRIYWFHTARATHEDRRTSDT